MRIEDDTPEAGNIPPEYPSRPPTNLLRGLDLVPNNFFAFEGIDGAGKSTILKLVMEGMSTSARHCVGFRLGRSEVVAHALERAKWQNANPVSLNLLHWTSLFENTLANSAYLNNPAALLFADRYTLSIKVRGALEGLSTDYMDLLELLLPRPTKTFLFDVPPEVCLGRILAGKRTITYFEAGFRDVEELGGAMIERSVVERASTRNREEALLNHLTKSRTIYLRLADQDRSVVRIANRTIDESARIISAEIMSSLCSAPNTDITSCAGPSAFQS